MARCRAGEEAAWAELVEHFSRYVYAITTQAFRLSQHEAEDVFQEVFTRAYEKLDTLREDGAVRPWLAQMTRRLAIDRIRASGREVTFAEPPDEIVEGEIARVDAAMTVRDALRALPDNCQEIVDRFFTRDESYRTISEALDIPSGTIASRISRCLDKLRGELDDDVVGHGRDMRRPASS